MAVAPGRRAILVLFFLLVLGFSSHLAVAAESVSFKVVSEVQNLSGNNKPGCDSPVFVDGTFEFEGQTLADGFLGCCGLFFGHITGPLTNTVGGEGAYSGSYTLTAPLAEICCTPNVLVSGAPSCFDQDILYIWPTGDQCQESHRPNYFEWVVFLTRNTNSSPIAQWSIKDAHGEPLSSGQQNGFYQLPADGMSQAIATVINTTETPTFVFTGDSLGCTLTPDGVLTAGTNKGTVQVTAQITDPNPCLQRDFFFELNELNDVCSACQTGGDCAMGDSETGNDSVHVKIGLGTSRNTSARAFLEVIAGVPTLDLGTPKLLKCSFYRPDLEKITNAVTGWLQQIRAFDGSINIVTNNASSYSLNFYYPTNVMPKLGGLYQFNGSAFKTITIELVSGDTNHVRVTDSLYPAPSDYYWQATGWELVTGTGLRHETKTVTVAGAIRTEDRTIKNNAGVLQRETIQQWQTNTFGDRLSLEVLGAGADARTNSYGYSANGLLSQVIRGDGSWDIYAYDSPGRQIQHFSPFLNSAVTHFFVVVLLAEVWS